MFYSLLLAITLSGAKLPNDFATTIEYEARTTNGSAVIYSN